MALATLVSFSHLSAKRNERTPHLVKLIVPRTIVAWTAFGVRD